MELLNKAIESVHEGTAEFQVLPDYLNLVYHIEAPNRIVFEANTILNLIVMKVLNYYPKLSWNDGGAYDMQRKFYDMPQSFSAKLQLRNEDKEELYTCNHVRWNGYQRHEDLNENLYRAESVFILSDFPIWDRTIRFNEQTILPTPLLITELDIPEDEPLKPNRFSDLLED